MRHRGDCVGVGGHSDSGGEVVVMMEYLLDEARAANARLAKSMDDFLTELTAARDWARTVAPADPSTPSAVSNDEWPLRPGTTSRGPV
jgi:hypothetical protein